MREDFHRVIVDCYRINDVGGKRHHVDPRRKMRRGVSVRDLDENNELMLPECRLPQRAMRPSGWNRKNFGENLSPLYRFLQSRVGLPWDDTRSEMAQAGLNKSSTVKAHVWEHLDIWLKYDFFVDEDGLLQEKEHESYRQRRDRNKADWIKSCLQSGFIRVEGVDYIRDIEGNWFTIEGQSTGGVFSREDSGWYADYRKLSRRKPLPRNVASLRRRFPSHWKHVAGSVLVPSDNPESPLDLD